MVRWEESYLIQTTFWYTGGAKRIVQELLEELDHINLWKHFWGSGYFDMGLTK